MANRFRQALQQSSQSSDAPAKGNRFKQALSAHHGSALGGVESDMKSLVGGLTDAAGLPADLINPVLHAVGLRGAWGTSNDLRNLAARHGLAFKTGQEPNTFANKLARFTGSMALPQAGIETKAAQLADKAPEALSLGQNVLRSMSAPSKTAGASNIGGKAGLLIGRSVGLKKAGEKVGSNIGAALPHSGALVLAPAGAAAGGTLANDMYPNSPMATATGELLGGMAPSAMTFGPMGLAARGARYAGSKVAPFTRAGAMPRAAKRLQEGSGNVDNALASQDPNNFVPGADLTPARRSGEPTHLGIERTVLDQNPKIRKTVNANQDKASELAYNHAQMGGSPDQARSALESTRQSTLNKLHNNAKRAAEDAMDEVSGLSPDHRMREISASARQKILDTRQKAYDETVKPLWDKIPDKAPASLDHARQELQALHDQNPGRPKLVGIPLDVQDEVMKDEPITFGSLRKLRTMVRHYRDSARSGLTPKGDPVHDVGKLYSALTQDLDSTPGYGQAIQKARLASKELSDRFDRGIVGEISALKRTGDQSVAPEDTIHKMLTGSTKATQVHQALQSVPELAPELKDYLRSSFVMKTTDNGLFNHRAARTFLKNHADVLDELPGLKRELNDTQLMKRRSEALHKRFKNTDKLAYDARKSRTALYLNASPGKEWKAALNSSDPVSVARHLYGKVKHDKKATQGLKTSFVNQLFDEAKSGGYRDSGQPIYSGNRMDRLLKDHAKILDELHFTSDERNRLKQTVNTLSALEKKSDAGEPINTDTPSLILSSMVRVMGARAGGMMARHSEGGSIQTANIVSSAARKALDSLTLDKASSLISDAVVNNPKLYKALMTGPTESAKKRKDAERVFSAWMITPAATANEQPVQPRKRHHFGF